MTIELQKYISRFWIIRFGRDWKGIKFKWHHTCPAAVSPRNRDLSRQHHNTTLLSRISRSIGLRGVGNIHTRRHYHFCFRPPQTPETTKNEKSITTTLFEWSTYSNPTWYTSHDYSLNDALTMPNPSLGTKRSKRSPPLSGIWRSLQPRRSTETVQLSNVSRLSSSSRKSFILHKSISAPSSAFETNTPDSRQFCSSDDGSGIGLLNSSRYGSIADSRPQVPPILSHPQSTLSSLSSPSSSFFPDHSLRTCTTPSLTPVPRSFTHLDSGPLRWKDTESSTNVNARPTVIEGPPPGYEYGRRIERRPRLGFFPSWWVRALPKAADLNDPGGEH
jgi:hypothetical protein